MSNLHRKFRLGILQCGEVSAELQSCFGDYNLMVIRAIQRVGIEMEYMNYRVFQNDFPSSVKECDAWITTGSKTSVNDDMEWTRTLEDFVCQLPNSGRPFIGICYGMQMMAKALGGRVDVAKKGWGIGVATSRIYMPTQWMKETAETINLLVSHSEQVVELPQDTVRIAGSKFCPNSIIGHGETMIGFQGHPEFTPEYSRALMELRRNIIPEDTVKEGRASLDNRIDGDLAFAWIGEFLRIVSKAKNRI